MISVVGCGNGLSDGKFDKTMRLYNGPDFLLESNSAGKELVLVA